jgi:hypothetical protein
MTRESITRKQDETESDEQMRRRIWAAQALAARRVEVMRTKEESQRLIAKMVEARAAEAAAEMAGLEQTILEPPPYDSPLPDGHPLLVWRKCEFCAEGRVHPEARGWRCDRCFGFWYGGVPS